MNTSNLEEEGELYSKKKNRLFNFAIDMKFWAIIPAININIHMKTSIEIEWLCFGVYINE